MHALKHADSAEVDFLCFPEGFLTGYYAEKKLAEQNSIRTTSVEFQNFLKQTASFKVTFVIGFNEQEGDKIFDSAAVIEKGVILGIQRKHYLYHDYFTSDDHFTVFQSKGVKFGVVICLDTNYFEPSRLLALQGATILFTPMCNKVPLDHAFVNRPPYYSHFVARAHENRCWLVGADWVWPNDGKTTCPGHSVIYDPDGREIARSQEGLEDFIVTDISKDCLFHEKGRRVDGSPILAQEMAKIILGEQP
ncbi:MAG: carbon-nitrogen hydrolase family protein [Parachlamydiaceae bacterium]|nr:carbon-nitrogen hydrolase family protein [Parachlamydiaceae bacterium]